MDPRGLVLTSHRNRLTGVLQACANMKICLGQNSVQVTSLSLTCQSEHDLSLSLITAHMCGHTVSHPLVISRLITTIVFP